MNYTNQQLSAFSSFEEKTGVKLLESEKLIAASFFMLGVNNEDDEEELDPTEEELQRIEDHQDYLDEINSDH